MSTFQVRLNQTQLSQGNQPTSQARFLDQSIISGRSIQRSFYAMGPDKTSRKLKDGDIFNDVNYWKRFAFPVLPLDQAFIVVLNDDQTIWNDNPIDNHFPASYNFNVNDNTDYSSNVADILNDYGSLAVSIQIQVTGSGTAPIFRFNGSATYAIAPGFISIFDNSKFPTSKIEINNQQAGHAFCTVSILLNIINTTRGGNPMAFFPSQISGLHTWFAGDNGTFQDTSFTIPSTNTGDAVSGWQDKSGNLHNALAIGPPPRLTKVNGLNAVFFDGQQLSLKPLQTAAFNPILVQPTTIFCVASFSNGVTIQYFYDGLTSSNRQAIYTNLPNPNDMYGFAGGAAVKIANVPYGATPNYGHGPVQLTTCQFNGVSSIFRWNGADSGSISDNEPDSLDGLTVGGRFTTDFVLGGNLCELILYRRLLSLNEIKKVERYLKSRWGTP